MKHNMKAIAAILAAAVLVTGCFAGCSRKGSASAAPAAAEATTEKTETGAAETAGSLRLGQVTAIDGTSVTLALSDQAMDEQMGHGFDGRIPDQSGEMPTPPEGASGATPQMPSGQTQSGEMPTPPEGGMPSGRMPGGTEHGRGGFEFQAGSETVTVTVEESVAVGLKVGDLMLVRFGENGEVQSAEPLRHGQMHGGGQMPGDGQMPGGPGGGMPGQGGSASTGTAASTVCENADGATYTSSAADENAARVDGATVTLNNVTLTKTGASSNTETSDFYGMNAGLLATNGANVTVTGGSFTTDGAGANALFCCGSGTSLTVRDAVIRTSSNNSGGIQTAGGGTTTAENLDVETAGASAAAIRSDRGGGVVTVTGGTYVTKGTGSPAVYSTADITVSGATLTAEASEAVVVEGKNSVTLNDCTLTGSMQGTYGKGSTENLQAVMIYQSMSGDAAMGAGSFTMTGGSLQAKSGDLFYVTNTTAQITLSGVELTPANGVLLRACGNDGSRGWGAAGSNGATVTMTASAQRLVGEILADEISSLSLTLSDGSSFEGAVNPDGAAGRVSLTLGEDCTWKLTGDAWLSAFSGDLSSVDVNGYHLYVAGEQVK